MFESLTEQLSQTLRSLAGKAKITEDNVQEALGDVRRALLEADVALPVVRDFIERVKLRALGQEVGKSLSPGQAFIRIVQAELQMVMGNENTALDLRAVPPAIVLMAGLQGAGKTTTVAKLALLLKNDTAKWGKVIRAKKIKPE